MPDLDIVARLKLAAESFSSEFDSRMKRVEDTARSTSSRVNAAISGIGSATQVLVAGVGIAAITDLARRGLDYASSLGEVAQQLGVTTRDLQVYRFAGSQVGIEQDAMDRGLAKLTVTLGKAALGAKEPQKAFEALGINVRDANGHVLTAGQVIPRIADALAKVSDPAQRAAVEVALFGKAGQQLDTLLAGGSGQINQLADAAQRLGIILSDSEIQHADETADKLSAMKQVLEANISHVIVENSNAILGLANSLTTAAVGLAKWWAQKPEQAYGIIGGLAGARFGPIGAAAGASLGYEAGLSQKRRDADANMDLAFRKQKLEEAERAYQNRDPEQKWYQIFSVHNAQHPASSTATAELTKQRQLMDQARAAAKALADAPQGNTNLTDFLDTATKHADTLTKAQRAAQEQAKKNAAEIKGLIAEGDPVGEASAKFQQSVALIQDQLAKGLITQEQADTAGRAAGQAYGDALTQAIADQAATFQKSHPELAWLWDDTFAVKRFDPGQIEKSVAGALPDLQGRTTPNADIRQVSELLESALGYRIGGAPSRVLSVLGGSASNDNFSKGLADAFSPLTKALDGATRSIDKHLGEGGDFQKSLGTILGNASLGNLGGGIFQSLGGGKDSKLASGLGGALGGAAGKALGPAITTAIGGTLGKTLGGAAGPLGAIAGGIAGDLVAKLLGGHTTGKSTITFTTGGGSASSGFGTNASANAAAVGEANTILQGVQQVAKALGASINAYSGITVGTRDGDYRVNVGGTSLKTGKGAKNFDDDQAAAIQYAIAQSIQRGVITGISQASINIIKSGQDLTTAIGKAELIEAVPKSLKAMLDPVGAAIDDLNSKWRETIDALREGGASAQQMAQAQDLYNRQLDQIKASTDAADASLQSFKKSLILGSDSPYSLRDQAATAKAALQPYLDTISSGGSIDQQKYQAAAQAFLDIERQLYGSTEQYFSALDAIQAATSKAIETIDNATPIGGSTADPFASSTATATQQTASNTATGNQLLSQVSDQLAGIAQQLANANGGAAPSDFIGAARGFA